MTPQQTLTSTRYVIQKLIEAGLSNEQRFPVLTRSGHRRYEIGIEGAPDLSAALKNIPYDDAFFELERAGAFNVKMIDGALLQLGYVFQAGSLESHRLAFFPAPRLEAYEEARSIYDEDEVFGDIVGKYLVRFPIRFDFNCSEAEHVDIDHPKTHLSLGQYKNCRIPVTGPLTPARFVAFIIRNFYFSTLPQLDFGRNAHLPMFPDSISLGERGVPHLVA